MKKLFILCFLALGAFTAQSQSIPMLSSDGLAIDTATNSTATYIGLKVSGNYRFASVQYVMTKISGTVAGTAVLQASNDGVTFITVDTSAILATNSFTNTDVATQSTIWTLIYPSYLYYRILVTGSGTMSATYKGFFVGKKDI